MGLQSLAKLKPWPPKTFAMPWITLKDALRFPRSFPLSIFCAAEAAQLLIHNSYPFDVCL
jgi:hypothetical protein